MYVFSAEINRLCQEKDADNEKFDFQREDLNKRLAQLERDMQMALTQEKQSHEDDVDRLTRERVGIETVYQQLIHFFIVLIAWCDAKKYWQFPMRILCKINCDINQ